MRFDDRLLTVFSQPAGDRHDAAVRWRQLVDLVARAGSNSASPMVAAALECDPRRRADVDEDLRAAAARAVAALPLPLGAARIFRVRQLAVSAPVLAAATLEPAQWRRCWRSRTTKPGGSSRRFIPSLQAGARRPKSQPSPRWPSPTDRPRRASAEPPAAAPVAERRRRSESSGAAAAGSPHAARGAAVAPAEARRRCSAGNAGRAAKSPGSTARRAGA